MHERGRSYRGWLFCLALIAASIGVTLSAALANAAAVLPPELVALEQHTSELKLTSLRFTLAESTIVPAGEHEITKVLKLLGSDSTTTGEETLVGLPPTFRLPRVETDRAHCCGRRTSTSQSSPVTTTADRGSNSGRAGWANCSPSTGKPLTPSPQVKPQTQRGEAVAGRTAVHDAPEGVGGSPRSTSELGQGTARQASRSRASSRCLNRPAAEKRSACLEPRGQPLRRRRRSRRPPRSKFRSPEGDCPCARSSAHRIRS